MFARPRRPALLFLFVPVLFAAIAGSPLSVRSATCGTETSSLGNGGFESPGVPAATYDILDPSLVAPWSTTDVGIEVWGDGFLGVPAYEGSNFAELNANIAGTLYQDVVSTPGATMTWTLQHRGRDGTDVMQVLIGDALVADVSSDLGWNAISSDISDGPSAWGAASDTYCRAARPDMHAVRVPSRLLRRRHRQLRQPPRRHRLRGDDPGRADTHAHARTDTHTRRPRRHLAPTPEPTPAPATTPTSAPAPTATARRRGRRGGRHAPAPDHASADGRRHGSSSAGPMGGLGGVHGHVPDRDGDLRRAGVSKPQATGLGRLSQGSSLPVSTERTVASS